MNVDVDRSVDQRHVLMRRGLMAAGVLGALAVLCGAWAAHGLDDWLLDRGINRQRVGERVDQFNVGARYHLVHAVVLLGLVALSDRLAIGHCRWIMRFVVAGIVLFSGSLYVLVLTDTPWLGAITPLGGICWVVAWLWLAFAGFGMTKAS